MQIWWSPDFCGFGLENAVPIHTIFEPCHFNANVARWWNGHSSSYLPVLEYNDVDHRRLMCLNDLHQTLQVFLNVECHYVKTILPKTRKPFSCPALYDGIVPIHGAIVSGRLCCLNLSIELKEKNMSKMFQFIHLALHYLASTAPLTIFKWQNLKHNIWTSNKKTIDK